MEYQLIIKTDEHGQPRIEGHTGPLPPGATFTIAGSEAEEEDPWASLIIINDIIIETGAVSGVRISARHDGTRAALS
jgi:hypothetical protein